MKELNIGCGKKKHKMVNIDGDDTYKNLVTLDRDPDCNPDILWDLENLPLPFEDNEFDEIHAYEVLEHTGQQGDYEFFFNQFTDFWRILKPGGKLFATVPKWDCLHAWGDPSHKRVINESTLWFLSQREYKDQVGRTPMADFRYIYKADFDIIHQGFSGSHLVFVLQSIKENENE